MTTTSTETEREADIAAQQRLLDRRAATGATIGGFHYTDAELAAADLDEDGRDLDDPYAID